MNPLHGSNFTSIRVPRDSIAASGGRNARLVEPKIAVDIESKYCFCYFGNSMCRVR